MSGTAAQADLLQAIHLICIVSPSCERNLLFPASKFVAGCYLSQPVEMNGREY